MRLFPDADANPREGIRAGEIDDILDAVVSAVRPLFPDAQPAHIEMDVIVDDQRFFRRDLIKLHRLGHSRAAEIHQRIRL